MMEVQFDQGIHLPECGLWLDPRGTRPFAFVSHAHSDHTGHHLRTILTEPTARLMKARLGSAGKVHHVLRYGEARDFGAFRATLLPAGHVLGSAQILVEQEGKSLLYTGDFKLRKGISCEAAVTVQADTLVMETTYGLPHYRFPPAEVTVARIIAFCGETLAEGRVPVLLGYSLGKAQEILAALTGAGLPVMLHGAVWRMTRLCEEMGVEFPPYTRYEPSSVGGHVLLCPPASAGSAMLEGLPEHRVAMITGWALDGGVIHRYRCDQAFPLSDHADYDELLEMVERVAPKRVLTLHGFAEEFAKDLRERGIEAWSLTGGRQMDLPIPVRAPAPRGAASGDSNARTLGDSRAASGSFSRLAATTGAVTDEVSTAGKTTLLAAFLRELDPAELGTASRWLSGRIFPVSEERTAGVGPVLLRKALVTASGMNEGRYRVLSRRHRDLSKVAAEAMEGFHPQRSVTISDAEELIATLATVPGPEARIARLAAWMKVSGAQETALLVRVLVGEFRSGLGPGLLEQSLAAAFGRELEQVREAFLITGDAGVTASLAREDRLAEAEPEVFRPLRCMLASPLSGEEEAEQRLASPFWAEVKLDGVRAQLHAARGRAEFYSRDLKRISGSFPELIGIAAPLPGPLILDGEILAWDRTTDRPLPFELLQHRLGRDEGATGDLFRDAGGPGAGITVRFVPFDILLTEGCSLLRLPLAERRRMLEELPLPLGLSPLPVSRPESIRELGSLFLSARSSGHEGLLLKDPSSRYSPGKRGLSWFKLKKALATLDVVVTAVEYGHGKRAGVLSDYTFSVRRGGEGSDSGDLLVIGKAYTGLTDAEIAALTEVFLGLAEPGRGKRIPVRPEIVLEVAFDSIRESPRHSSGLALRFPRIRRVRHDKAPGEIDTLETASALLGAKLPVSGSLP
jgi:DNA ligase-1